MKPAPHNLKLLGWDASFEEQFQTVCKQNDHPARVIAVDRDQYLLLNEQGSFRAKLSGRFRHETVTAEQLPCVGDWLCMEWHEGDEFALIHHLLPRKTSLKRKAVGQSSSFQMIVANVDVVFIVQSCHYDFNLNRLERYLVMVAEGGAEPFILLTKTDLVSADELAVQMAQIKQAGITAPIMTLSNVTQEGLDAFYLNIFPGKTYCFVGSSGIGKSTLINGLLANATLETKGVSGTGEGRHTTVRRELIVLENGAMVIDTPGMRELGVMASQQSIDSGFVDINAMAQNCRYKDCSHTSEPGCAVLAGLESGEISQAHYDNFFKLQQESNFNQMSYAEKRKKDRDFGKFIKGVKKDIGRD